MQAAARVRELVASGRPADGAEAYPPEVRREVVAFALRTRAAGWTWAQVGSAVGLPPTTPRRWVLTAEAQGGGAADRERAEVTAPAVVPVEVMGEAALPPSEAEVALTLVSPRGFRVEGLSLGAAAQLLAVLG